MYVFSHLLIFLGKMVISGLLGMAILALPATLLGKGLDKVIDASPDDYFQTVMGGIGGIAGIALGWVVASGLGWF